MIWCVTKCRIGDRKSIASHREIAILLPWHLLLQSFEVSDFCFEAFAVEVLK